ncbi:MAG TPA: phosphatase PAP2 family protein [Alphaproteobacteria bacterium]|nr:phosphatase PAP2 family protein [Alphaproteobacteria bacterium]
MAWYRDEMAALLAAKRFGAFIMAALGLAMVFLFLFDPAVSAWLQPLGERGRAFWELCARAGGFAAVLAASLVLALAGAAAAAVPALRRRALDFLSWAGFSLGALGFAWGLVRLEEMLFGRPRPWAVAQGIPARFDFLNAGPEFGSMPAAQGTAAFAFACLLSMRWPRLAPLFYALALLGGLGPVMLGQHWPSDVMVGAVTGVATVLLLRLGVTEGLNRYDARTNPAA